MPCWVLGARVAAALGIPWESSPAIVCLDLVGLVPGGESIIGLVPEEGPIVRA